MRKFIILSASICLFLCFTGFYRAADAFISLPQDEGVCLQNNENSQECIEKPAAPEKTAQPERIPGVKKPVQPLQAKKEQAALQTQKEVTSGMLHPVKIHFFWGKGCPHCAEEEEFLKEMKKKYPSLEIYDYEVWYDETNATLLVRMAKAYKLTTSGVPVTFIGNQGIVGFSQHTREELEQLIPRCLSEPCIDPYAVLSGKVSPETPGTGTQAGEAAGKSDNLECTEKSRTVYIPWIGNIEASESSLPLMTLVIAGLDSFNPCAFFVLFSLLGIMIHAQSRKRMLLTGGVFVFFSGFIYFVFMAAWLNLFLVMGQVAFITKIAGSVAIIIALINIKDFFVFKKGVSLTIPDSAKPKLFDRMRKLLKSTSVVSVLIGTAVLAIAANSYELLCTAGFPMVFTRILTLNNLPSLTYYFYLVLYNIVYVIPLSVIVVLFTVTLGKKHLTEWQGRMLKLVSGTMMLGLGGVLLVQPEILNSTLISFSLLLGALAISGIIILFTRKFLLQKDRKDSGSVRDKIRVKE
jgi:thiol-disulfide isomerase/thioredoxin